MNIGLAARHSGLPEKTIRYYEEIGLVHPDRDLNGYRSFSDQHVHKLAFISRGRSLGFSVKDCRALLELFEDRGRASADVKKVANEHLAQIDRKLSELSGMRSTLSDLIKRCQGDHRPNCPILDDLASGHPPVRAE